MICGSSGYQGKTRQAELARQGIWVWDRAHNVHGRYTSDGFVPSKGKVRK